MRIISKFFDYYDKALAYGIDTGRVYVREEKEFNVLFSSPDRNHELFSIAEELPDLKFLHKTGLIAFCGKIYPFFSIYYGNKLRTYYSIESYRNDLDSESLLNFLIEELRSEFKNDSPWAAKKKIEAIKNDLDNSGPYKYWRSRPPDYADKYIGKSIEDDIFIKYNSPVLLVFRPSYKKDDIKGIINPRLKDYEFYRVQDPYTAFQEISMFLGSNLVKQVDPEINFSDDLKRDIHGFDEWSFRKPGKRK